MIKRAKDKPLQLEGNLLTVSTELMLDRSILLAKNVSPKTSSETFKNFIESTRNVDVLDIVWGKDGKAIIILEDAIGEFMLRLFLNRNLNLYQLISKVL